MKASHLIEGAPTLTISKFIAEGVTVTQLDGEVLDVRGENLSSHPHLLAESPRISVRSRSKKLIFTAKLRGAAGMNGTGNDEPGADGEDNRIRFTYLGLPVDTAMKSVTFPRAAGAPLSGGTMDIDIRGGWSSAGGRSR